MTTGPIPSRIVNRAVDFKRPSLIDCVADPITLVAVGIIIGVTIAGNIRDKMQSSAFEQLLEDRLDRDRIHAAH